MTRVRLGLGGTVTALALAVISIAWACTPDQMVGYVWFCPTSSFCASTSTQSFNAGSTVYARLDSGWANTDYYVRYIAGSDLMFDCHSSSNKLYNLTNSSDVFRSTSMSTFNKKTTMMGTPGAYSVCGTPLNGSAPTIHTNVTVL